MAKKKALKTCHGSWCKFEMAPYGNNFYAVNVNCLDDLQPKEIIASPKEIRHL